MNWNDRYIKQAGKAANDFYKFHEEFKEFPPRTVDLCSKGSELARAAYHETKQGHFLGLAKRYENHAQSLKPQESQQPLFEEEPTRKNPPTPYKNPMSHPHYLGDGWIP